MLAGPKELDGGSVLVCVVVTGVPMADDAWTPCKELSKGASRFRMSF